MRRTIRNWGIDPTRADRNAVIQRIVSAAATESKDQLPSPAPNFRHQATPPPAPSPLTAQLLGQEPPEEPIPNELIGRRAHEIWLRNGRPTGTATADWQQAEAELRAERRKSS